MSSETTAISVPSDPPREWIAAVDEGLDRYNRESSPVATEQRNFAFATDVDGRVIGGAVGRTWGRCCELQQLWVEPAHRNAGIGSRLVAAFETRARERGCDIFYLTTLSFQAPDFYRKLGYRVLAEIPGHANDIVKYVMHKSDVTD